MGIPPPADAPYCNPALDVEDRIDDLLPRLTWDGYISKALLEGCESEKVGAGRQGFVVSLYDDMMVIARYDFTDGVSSLGADWVMPLNWGTGNGETSVFER